jgi:hypothetical protein
MKLLKGFLWIAVLLPVTVFAQRGNGWCSNANNYNKMYNPKTVEEFKGTVVAVENITPEKGMSTGIHLSVKNAKNETVSVHLGPSWYVDNQDLQIAKGDAVTVKGSRVTYNNAPAVIAQTIAKGDDVLLLRDDQGNPNWNGWRKGNQAQCQQQCQAHCQGQGKGQGKGQKNKGSKTQ